MSTKRWECAGTSLSDTACESDKGPDRLGVQWGVGGERNGALQVRALSEAGEEGRAEGARDARSLSLSPGVRSEQRGQAACLPPRVLRPHRS